MAKGGLDNKSKNALKNAKQPMLIVRPASKMLGLDMLHVSLIVLVIILVALAFGLANFHSGSLLSCNVNGTVNPCATHNSTQALAAAEKILAGYENSGGAIQLLPYYSLPNKANVTYLQAKGEWIVTIPYVDPTQNNAHNNMTLLLYDKNLTLAQPYIQIFSPVSSGGDQTVAFGVVQKSATTPCPTTTATGKTYPMYVFVDPYAPGAVVGIQNAITATQQSKGILNTSYKFIFTQYAVSKYNNFGVLQTQLVGDYLACAAKQSQFPQFISNFSQYFTGNPIGNNTLQSIEYASGVNRTAFNGCIFNATAMLQGQALQAKYYNISTTPVFLLDCKYQTLPATVNNAVAYMLNNSK